jgi:mannose-6-phosphate isomerase-like protein (cupin superfamily)
LVDILGEERKNNLNAIRRRWRNEAMVIKTSYHDIEPYRTKDGSLIRELMHPAVHGSRGASLAEAVVNPGRETLLHRHHGTQEIYHITEGSGHMTLGAETFSVQTGDTVFIPSGMAHGIRNTSRVRLKILCCCLPPYSHDDTEVMDISLDRHEDNSL